MAGSVEKGYLDNEKAYRFGSTGLPVGVQVAARYWREDILLAVIAALEEQFQKQPDYPRCPVSVAV